MIISLPRLSAVTALTLLVLLPSYATAAEASAAPRLELKSVRIEPAKPGADTLCRLRVDIYNGGDQVASQLGFVVRINGQEVPVYANQLFMFPLPPGEASELALFNFWTTETGRPMPPDGKLRVDVELREAQWMRIETVENVETWTPLGAVDSLPSAASLTVELSR